MCVRGGGGGGGGGQGVGRGGWVGVWEGESEWYRHVFVILKMIYRNDPCLIIVYLYWLTRIFTDSMCPEDTFEPHQEKTHLPTCVLNDSLRKHAYSNTLNISQPKTESFQTKILILLYFCISAQNIDCGYPLEWPHRGGSYEYPQSMYWAEIRQNNVYPFKPNTI